MFTSFFCIRLFNIEDATRQGEFAYENVDTWGDQVPGQNIFELEKLLIPIYDTSKHWLLVCVDMERKEIAVLDSIPNDARKLKYFRQIRRYLAEEYSRLHNGQQLPEPFEQRIVDAPQQHNPYDCGVYTAMNAEQIMLGVNGNYEWSFEQREVDTYRTKIANFIRERIAAR